MKKVIIVGASSGIGKALAKIFIEQGYKLGITGRRENLLHEIAAAAPDRVVTSAFDCTAGNNEAALRALAEKLGGLDLLIMSSGTGELNRELNFEIEKATVDLNVTAFTEIMDWAYKYFSTQGRGQIANISSIAGLRGGRAAPAYNASKAYQVSYLQGLRQKATKEKKQIVVTDLRPGFVKTAMAKGGGQFWVASPEKAASQIYSALTRKKAVAYITKRWWLIALILKILPNNIYNKM